MSVQKSSKPVLRGYLTKLPDPNEDFFEWIRINLPEKQQEQFHEHFRLFSIRKEEERHKILDKLYAAKYVLRECRKLITDKRILSDIDRIVPIRG